MVLSQHDKRNLILVKISKSLPYLILLISCTMGIVILQNSEIKNQTLKSTKDEYFKAETQEKLSLKLFQKVPSLGFQNLLADWLYLKFIQYFGDSEAREKIGYSLSPEFFSQVVDRDPRFIDAIAKLDTATSIFNGNPQKSVDLLTKSLNQIPPQLLVTGIRPYYIWVYKGINELLFLGDPEAAKKSYTMARNWTEKYTDQPSKRIASRTAETIKFLEKNPKSKIPQIGAWSTILSNNPDPRTVKRAIQEISKLGGQVTISPDGKLMVRVPPNIQ